MSYSTANPPVLLVGANLATYDPDATALSTDVPGGKQGMRIWGYSSTNPTATVQGSGFFSNARQLGMQPGDLLFGCYYSSAGSSIVSYGGFISAVSTAGAANLSTGGTFTSTFG